MRARSLFTLSILIIFSMLLGACGKAPEAPPQTLHVNLGSYPATLDPQKASFFNQIAHLKLIYEGLTRQDANLETVPGAAEKWEYSADATELTFTLRPNLKYSDGSVLNAKRFEFSILRYIDPTMKGYYAAVTDDITGAAEWHSADLSKTTPEQLATLKAAVRVQALDSKGNPCASYEQQDCNTLKIGFKQPAAYFHTVMSLWATYPAKEELIKAGGDDWYLHAKYLIGNGPMILSTLDPGNQALFIPNPNYWRGTARVNVEFSYITDSAASIQSYKDGKFDIIPLGAQGLADAQQDATLNAEKMIHPGSCTFALMFHQMKEPFTDQKVREAFAYALDRDAWVRDVLKGLGEPTLTWIPPGFPGYDATENRWGFNPDKARKAIADSSYGSVDNLPEITLTFPDTPRNRTLNEWLAGQYKNVLGIDIKLNPIDSTAYADLTKEFNTAPQIYLQGWCADYPDLQNWLSVYWKTGVFSEKIGYSNPELDAKLNEADATVDTAKRLALYVEAQKMLTDTAPVAFFWNNVNAFLVKPYVKGIQATPMDSGWPGDMDPLSITIEK